MVMLMLVFSLHGVFIHDQYLTNSIILIPNNSAADDTTPTVAYLLSFSIIILNTDLHNENIKANRRMKLADFIRNNKNYGKDISDGDLPDEYLEGIYQ